MSVALRLKKLSKSFGKATIICDANLEINTNERHAIIGPNGAGKSTLFDLISGRIEPTKGEIQLFGKKLNGLTPYQINRLGLSRSFQITNIFPKMDVFENMRCSLLWSMGLKYSFWNIASMNNELSERIYQILEQINLTSRVNHPAGMLSYAEQRALEIGITIAGGSDVILLDEPTAGMSRSETAKMVDLIRKISKNKTLVMVEHDMGVVFDLADKISVLVYGEIIISGTSSA